MNDLDKAQMMAPEGEFLAYINPKEAGILKALGGSGKMTSMGIPSFTEDEQDQAAMNAPDYESQDNEEQQSIDRGDPTANMSTRSRDLQGFGPGTNINDLYGGGAGGNNFIQTVGNLYNRFSPVANIGRGIRGIGRGIGNLFSKLADLRGFNPDGSRRTQAEYEEARQNRINENRIANIMGRDAPFTQLTLDRLERLGAGPQDPSLIGTTNNMRTINDPTFGPVTQGTIYDAEEPELGILSQAPDYNFRDAMREINLDRGFTGRQNLGQEEAKSMMEEYYNTPIENRMTNTSGYNVNDIDLAGLNQEQVDYLNTLDKRNKDVGNTNFSANYNSLRNPNNPAGAFFSYKSPQEVLNTVMGLNEKSTGLFSSKVDPDKNVYGDKNTFAQPDEITNYIQSLATKGDRTYSFGIPQNEKGNKYMDLARGGFIKDD